MVVVQLRNWSRRHVDFARLKIRCSHPHYEAFQTLSPKLLSINKYVHEVSTLTNWRRLSSIRAKADSEARLSALRFDGAALPSAKALV